MFHIVFVTWLSDQVVEFEARATSVYLSICKSETSEYFKESSGWFLVVFVATENRYLKRNRDVFSRWQSSFFFVASSLFASWCLEHNNKRLAEATGSLREEVQIKQTQNFLVVEFMSSVKPKVNNESFFFNVVMRNRTIQQNTVNFSSTFPPVCLWQQLITNDFHLPVSLSTPCCRLFIHFSLPQFSAAAACWGLQQSTWNLFSSQTPQDYKKQEKYLLSCPSQR